MIDPKLSLCSQSKPATARSVVNYISPAVHAQRKRKSTRPGEHVAFRRDINQGNRSPIFALRNHYRKISNAHLGTAEIAPGGVRTIGQELKWGSRVGPFPHDRQSEGFHTPIRFAVIYIDIKYFHVEIIKFITQQELDWFLRSFICRLRLEW